MVIPFSLWNDSLLLIFVKKPKSFWIYSIIYIYTLIINKYRNISLSSIIHALSIREMFNDLYKVPIALLIHNTLSLICQIKTIQRSFEIQNKNANKIIKTYIFLISFWSVHIHDNYGISSWQFWPLRGSGASFSWFRHFLCCMMMMYMMYCGCSYLRWYRWMVIHRRCSLHTNVRDHNDE